MFGTSGVSEETKNFHIKEASTSTKGSSMTSGQIDELASDCSKGFKRSYGVVTAQQTQMAAPSTSITSDGEAERAAMDALMTVFDDGAPGSASGNKSADSTPQKEHGQATPADNQYVLVRNTNSAPRNQHKKILRPIRFPTVLVSMLNQMNSPCRLVV